MPWKSVRDDRFGWQRRERGGDGWYVESDVRQARGYRVIGSAG